MKLRNNSMNAIVLDYRRTCGGKLFFPLIIFSMSKEKPLRHIVNYGKGDCLTINSLNVEVSGEGGGTIPK